MSRATSVVTPGVEQAAALAFDSNNLSKITTDSWKMILIHQKSDSLRFRFIRLNSMTRGKEVA